MPSRGEPVYVNVILILSFLMITYLRVWFVNIRCYITQMRDDLGVIWRRTEVAHCYFRPASLDESNTRVGQK